MKDTTAMCVFRHALSYDMSFQSLLGSVPIVLFIPSYLPNSRTYVV